jgi:hypothetical protein
VSGHTDALFPTTDIGAVIGVDDHKGSKSGDSSSPRLIVGRLFFRSDATRVEQLFKALAAAQAQRWHASTSGMGGLFCASEADRKTISSALRATDTHTFGTNPTRGMLAAPHLDAEWQRLWRSRSELVPRKAGDARVLFHFLSHTHGQAHCYFPCLRKSRILFVVDRQDWFRDTSQTARASVQGFAKVTMPVDSSVRRAPPGVWLRTKPADQCDPTLAALLGLVDSDLWAFGKVLSVRGADGRTVHDALNADYRHRGLEQPLAGFTPEELENQVPQLAREHFEEFFIRAHRVGRSHVVGGPPRGPLTRTRDFLNVHGRLLLGRCRRAVGS